MLFRSKICYNSLLQIIIIQNAPVDECVLAAMRWGLVPSWFKESDPRKVQYNTNNCRSDTLLEKKSYKVLSESYVT